MYKSCIRINQFAMFLVSGLYVDGITVGLCCAGSTVKGYKIPGIKFDTSPEKTMNNFIELRENLIAEAKGEIDASKSLRLSSLCKICPMYHDDTWNPSKKISLVSIAMYPAPCNAKCIYCTVCIHHHTGKNQKFVPQLHGPIYEKYFELLEYARSSNLIAADARYEVGSGEIAIHPYKGKILDFVKGQATSYLTNCIRYDDRVAENLAENAAAIINTSIDAGTPETWRRIKGVDCFDKTVQNIKKYCKKAQHPRQVMLKYIIQPGFNTNAKDYEAVTQLVQQLGSNCLVIAGDVMARTQKQLDDSVHAAGKLLSIMARKGIDVGWDAFSEANQQKIIDIARSLLESSPTNKQMTPTMKQPIQAQTNNKAMRPQLNLQEASNLLSAGNYEEAGKMLLELTKSNMAAPGAYYMLARLSNLTNDPSTAKNLYYKAFKLKRNLCSVIMPKEHPNHGYVFKGQKNEEKAERCPLCGNPDSVPRWCYCMLEMHSSHVRAYNPVRTWMYCEDCHHMYAEEFPFQQEAAVSELQFEGEKMNTKTQLFAYNSEILRRLISFAQGDELLEIGIGGGEFALAAKEMGFNVLALDVSESNVKQATKYGLNAQVQDIMTFDTDKKWDIIIMGDVIEHVACPVAVMEKASSLLTDSGVLWVSTPNFEASFAILAGHSDPMRLEASHKNYFSRESLFGLLSRFNFTPVDYRISSHYRGSMEIIALKL